MNGRLWLFVLLFGGCISVWGCSRSALSLILDLPAPEPASTTNGTQTEAASFTDQQILVPRDTVRPPIERLSDPDSVLRYLPRDAWGNVDWAEAARTGVIRPRPAIPGTVEKPVRLSGYDFFYERADSSQGAYFPHSSHTELMDCGQCHPAIFPTRNQKVGMGDIFQGKFCGECHGPTAFPVTTCSRCHLEMTMPPSESKPGFPEPIQISQPEQEEEASEDDAPRLTAEGFPSSIFPHWSHQLRYQCRACHMEVFDHGAGGRRITMDMINSGESCGLCHNGEVAFDSGFGNCERCHVRIEG